MQEWYLIQNIDKVDSPALVIYPERVEENIEAVINIAGNPDQLRPHVKTHKMAHIARMLIHKGITRFKCATIAEAEMLAQEGAPDILLAYQPVGPKIERFMRLIKTYPETRFACLVDNQKSAGLLNNACYEKDIQLDIFIDLNVGMGRTGIIPEKVTGLVKYIRSLSNLVVKGLHAYDGHIHDSDKKVRKEQADISYQLTEKVHNEISHLFPYPLTLVVGGTPTFAEHIQQPDCECSPGTFVFWDWGYAQMMPELPFQYAALLVSRVISVIDTQHICLDLGYKAIASESPLPRIYFLNAVDAEQISHSEEHMVLKVPDSTLYPVGSVLYGVPLHICPTVALYDKVYVVCENRVTDTWNVTARDRRITI